MKENLTISEQIGLRLRVLRVERTFSTEDVARVIRVSRKCITNLENGESEQPLNLVARLAMLYVVSLEYIVTGSDSKSKQIHGDS